MNSFGIDAADDPVLENDALSPGKRGDDDLDVAVLPPAARLLDEPVVLDDLLA